MAVGNRPIMVGYPSKNSTQNIAVAKIGTSTLGYGSHTTDKEIDGEVSRVTISAPKKTGTSTINIVNGFSSITISMGN